MGTFIHATAVPSLVGLRNPISCAHKLCAMADNVNHPQHYTRSPSGVECIDVVEHLNFCRGNAMKYLWRAGQKDSAKELEDLQKAAWYLAREIARVQAIGGQREWVPVEDRAPGEIVRGEE